MLYNNITFVSHQFNAIFSTMLKNILPAFINEYKRTSSTGITQQNDQNINIVILVIGLVSPYYLPLKDQSEYENIHLPSI